MPTQNGGTTAAEDKIIKRQALVAQLRLRGLTAQEVWSALVKADMLNADGEPYSLATIKRDIQDNRSRWDAEAKRDTAEHRARQFAEIGEIKKQAWQKGDGELALKAIDREIKLTGTAAAIKIEMSLEIYDLLVVVVRELQAVDVDPAEMFNDLLTELAARRTEQRQQANSALPAGQALSAALDAAG